MAIPKDVEGAFFSGEHGGAVKFCYNDTVTVAGGDHAGKKGIVVLLLEMDPQIKYMLSLDDGSDIEVLENELSA